MEGKRSITFVAPTSRTSASATSTLGSPVSKRIV